MKTYVVAWHYEGGAGFDWYKTAEAADLAYEQEKTNADAFASQGWTAYRFDFLATAEETATEEIDADLDALCSGALLQYQKEKETP